MKTNRPYLLLSLSLTAVLALSACGGGGSGSDNAPPSGTTTLSAITVSNSTPAAANAYAANGILSDTAGDAENLVGNLVSGVSVNAGSLSAVKPVLDVLYRLTSNPTPRLVTGVVESVPCTSGGTLTADGTIADETKLTNGDTAKVTAAKCAEEGLLIDGSFTYTVSGVSGSFGPTDAWSATIDLRFTQFKLDTGSESGTLDGDMRIVVKQDSAASRNVTGSGTSLKAIAAKSGAAATEITLKNYTATGTESGATFASAANYSLSGSTSALGQFAYEVKNLQPFVYTSGALKSGALVVTGSPATVTLTVVDSGNVRVDYSANGDGVVTQSNTVSLIGLQSNL